MKSKIHPDWNDDTKVTCACGNEFTTGSVKKSIETDICSECHPFFTGEQRIVDTEGQVDRFLKRVEAREKYVSDKDARAAEKVSPDRLISELSIGKRAIDALAKVKITNAGEFIEKLAEGEEGVLAIDGFGRKSLADVKKGLRRLGYVLQEDVVEKEKPE